MKGETLFKRVVGDTPKTRVLEFLIEGRELDYSISDIAEGAEIGRTTLFRIWPDIVNAGIVRHTRDIGNAKLYRLNIESPYIEKLVGLFDTILLGSLKKKTKLIARRNLRLPHSPRKIFKG
ncbi:MAG TPA: hypothetical protein HA282_03945 [Nanoarchaeota archaeon]|nr:MAG: hypothetical protein QT01_C0005G0023 [archaeon GW2011_AR6]MBS3082658.1 hypothetical protein [Candidatus Pacearchaeota archaeon]HIH34379.1 hypothetical protein [Nanoarchaeota archaeon]HIH51905.1 hypothetical protein [Nanoarchaeota archaeon]HIH66342.1 hypothetical protein [Nanoarchaeota archaeon]